jgi:hypothetical protein
MTPTELLVGVMELFSKSEPIHCVIAWTNEDENICIDSNCSASQAVGILEYAKARVLNGMMPKNGDR